jgi:hypothetical protein
MSDIAPTPAPAADSALTPAAADLLQPPTAMTIEQAQAKKAELFGTKGFAERVARGDPESVRQWREITRALRPAPIDQSTPAGAQYAKNMDSLAIYRARADLSDEALDWAAAEGPVSPAEREKASFAKQRLLKDTAFLKKLLDGDRAANSEWALINITLGSRVGTFQEIEDFKKAAAKRLAGTK